MPEFTENELRELYLKNRQGDLSARDKAVDYNLPLVHAICKRFNTLEIVSYDDLFQEGCIGLLKALTGYDPARGTRFSTYAVPFILGEIRACLRRNGHFLKLSRSRHESLQRLLKSKEELAQKLKRQPRLEELAAETGLTAEEIAWLMELQNSALPLQEKTNYPSAGEKNTVDSEMFLDNLIVQEKIKSLPNRERQIIILRYIMEKSQEEIARKLGLSQSHVSRLERKALKFLKENS